MAPEWWWRRVVGDGGDDGVDGDVGVVATMASGMVATIASMATSVVVATMASEVVATTASEGHKSASYAMLEGAGRW